MSLRSALLVVAATFALLHGVRARAHILLVEPAGRDPTGEHQGVSPCGNLPPATATPIAAGAALTVSWRNIQPHPGSYRLSLAEDENQLPQHVLVDKIPSPNSLQSMRYTIVLPNNPCPRCVLQLAQVNTSARDDRTPSGYIEYTACADLAIAAAPATDAAPAAGGAQPDVPGDGTAEGAPNTEGSVAAPTSSPPTSTSPTTAGAQDSATAGATAEGQTAATAGGELQQQVTAPSQGCTSARGAPLPGLALAWAARRVGLLRAPPARRRGV